MSGSIGYVGKQLFDSGFLSPLSLNPDSINSLSPLGYKDFFKINNHNANNLAVKASVDEINLANNLKKNARWITLNNLLIQLYDLFDKYLIKIFLS